MDHDAARGIAGPDRRPVASAVQCVGVSGERESPFALVLAVALEAVLFDDRLDLPIEVDPLRRRQVAGTLTVKVPATF